MQSRDECASVIYEPARFSNALSSRRAGCANLRATRLRIIQALPHAHALFDFLQQVYEPGEGCSLWAPREGVKRGYSPFWRVSWEAGPVEWGVLLTLGESMWLTELELSHDHRPEVMLQSGKGWYTEPHYRFDVGLIEDEMATLGRLRLFRPG